MWPFKRRESVSRALLQAVTGQQAAIGVLDTKVKALEDALAALEDKHERLRGKFYASRGEQKPTTTDKASILAAFRRGEFKA